MYKDSNNLLQMDSEQISMSMLVEDSHGVNMTGEIIDRIYENGILIDIREGHNLIVNSFLKLVMALCKGQSGYSGVQYWAVGSGAISWDTTVPGPELSATILTAEIGRVAIISSDMSFLNTDGSVSSTPTNILQIKHTFGTSDCNGAWREFGIFGGNATASINTGIMINKKHHAVITKTTEMTIERTMKFTLNLV